jgi:hypothetical protein
MLLIYVPKLTNRLGYTINVVMRDILQTEFAITTDADTLVHHPEAKLCYAPQPIASVDAIFLKSTHLLFETMIGEQECRYFDFNGTPAIFPVFHKDSALPFDPLAAIFYMLSRYEEYLPHRKDQHGRILITETLAYKNGFHLTPVVERWALMIKDLILEHYPETVFLKRNFSFEPTIDIDSAYCYLHKGWFRTCMGILRDGIHRRDPAEVKHRIRVLKKKEEDPYDTFDYIINLNKQYRFPLIFFALLGDYSLHDKPISYLNNEFRQLLQHIGDHSKVGIHGSYDSAMEPKRLEQEIQRLAEILHRPIYRNRYHFLRFTLPRGYSNLEKQGITQDYSMGFADQPGFRNGSCSTLPFFHLSRNQEINLNIHPFVAMDTTCHTHMNLSPEEAIKLYHTLIDEVKAVDGTFSCIFNNQNLCEDFGWEGWRAVYEEVLQYAYQHTQYTNTTTKDNLEND